MVITDLSFLVLHSHLIFISFYFNSLSFLECNAEEMTLYFPTYECDIWIPLLGLFHQPPFIASEVVLIILIVHV